MSCDDDPILDQECTVEGRWIIDGLEESTLYEFTDSLRYTIYSSEPGVFGTIEDAIPGPNSWYYEGDSIIVDLNFGNFLTAQPSFRCDCNVMDLSSEDGSNGVYYKEDYAIADCE